MSQAVRGLDVVRYRRGKPVDPMGIGDSAAARAEKSLKIKRYR